MIDSGFCNKFSEILKVCQIFSKILANMIQEKLRNELPYMPWLPMTPVKIYHKILSTCLQKYDIITVQSSFMILNVFM